MNNWKTVIHILAGCTALALAVKLTSRVLAEESAAKKLTQSRLQIDAIDAYIETQRKRLNIPGAVLAVVEGDQIVHQRGFGQARANGELPTPQTPFFIGSLTKSITALAVMQLVEAGKISLDAPVQRYLPWFRVADPQASARMTVRHLLNQTSGLPEDLGESLLADFDDRPGATERQLRRLSTLKLTHPVGSKCEYSNLNYNVLGLIIEAASGQLYAEYIQTHIFDPLEMKHSYTSKAEAKKNGLALGYRHWFSIPIPAPNLPVPNGSLPSGQLISCAEDMAHYLIAHLNGGRYKDVQILSPAGIEELHHGEAEYVKFGVSAGRYAMGWFETDLGQTKVYSHSGNVPEYSAFAALIPTQKRGLILLFNADPYGLPPVTGEIGSGAAAILAGQKPAEIRLDFIQWIMRLLPLIPLAQIAGAAAVLRQLRRWQERPQCRPSLRQAWGKDILLPLIPDLYLAGILFYVLQRKMFGFLRLFMPDVALTALLCGNFAGLWAILRSGLILGNLRKDS